MRLDVYLDPEPRPIGILTRDDRGDLQYTYRSGYAGIPLSMTMPVRETSFGDRVTRAFFENLLPEGDRREAIQAEHRLSTSDIAGMLSHVGRDCAGAVSVTPDGESPTKVPGDLRVDYRVISEDQLSEDVGNLARRRRPRSTTRHSLAGVQSKMAVAIDPERPEFVMEMKEGGAHVPSTHILKVGTGDYPAIEFNEFTCLGAARMLGLPAAEAEIRYVDDERAYLLVKRYDRVVTDGLVSRLHQEDGCQALGLLSRQKYQEEPAETDQDAVFQDGTRIWSRPSLTALRSLIRLSSQPVNDVRTLIRGVFFNLLIGNEDAHAKNFSYLHEAAGPRLAPFYDLVCIARYGSPGDAEFALWVGGCRRPAELTRACLENMLSDFQVRRVAHARLLDVELRGMTDTLLDAFDETVAAGPFAPVSSLAVRDAVVSRIDRVKDVMGW
jgi:serine/threonine-protein kinase HipA